ncbi:MAG: tetratricopeptide repeat protein, partial [Chitinispirillaceae bacterium]|nr:tetratricopeptide repeat protein [Chitinispirillaceae bacterium]
KLAEEEFKKALALNPELRSAQLNLALLSRKEEDMDLVAKSLQDKINNCKGEECSRLYLQLAILYYHRKMINKAISVLSSMKEELMEEKHYRHLALFYREMQEWQKAIQTLEIAAKKFVLEVHTEYELAELYLFAGNYSQAIKRFQALIPKWTENPWRLYYQLGYAWFEQNNLEQAQFYFEKSLKSKENVAARGLLAFVLNRKGNSLEARRLWEKNLNEDPSNPVLWINMGLSLENEKRYEEALSHYKKAQQLSPENKELYLNIGNALVGLQRYAEAIDAYNTALNSTKREIAAYNIFLVALKKREKERAEKMLSLLEREFSNSVYTKRCKSEMLLWNGDTTGALSILEAIKEKDETDWLTLARTYAAKGSTQKAKEYLDKLPSNDPSFKEEIRNIEAAIAFSEGNYSKAVEIMKEIKDTSFISQYNLAIAKYHAGQYQDALNIAEALSLKTVGKDYADVCRLAGNAAFSLKKWEEAKRWYSFLSNAEANNPVVQYNLAVANYNLNRIEEAWKYYQNAKKLDQSIYSKDIEKAYRKLKGEDGVDLSALIDSTVVWYNSAVELQQNGEDSAAEILYKKVVEKEPTHSEAWNNLGAIYGKRGDIDNAEKAYFKAIEKRHDIPETYANLVTLYIELEEFPKARKWVTKGLGHNPESEILQQLKEKIEIAEKEVKKRKEMEAKQKK